MGPPFCIIEHFLVDVKCCRMITALYKNQTVCKGEKNKKEWLSNEKNLHRAGNNSCLPMLILQVYCKRYKIMIKY